MRHLPNLISLIRLGLVWPVAWGLINAQYRLALTCFVIAGLSDGLDGFLARRFDWASKLGKVLDPVADKLLLMTVFLLCAWAGLTPWWLAAAAVARDLTIGVGAMLFRALVGPLHGRATGISKINTVAQLVYLASVMIHAIWDTSREALNVLMWLVLLTTLLSGADYVLTFVRRAMAAPSRHPS